MLFGSSKPVICCWILNDALNKISQCHRWVSQSGYLDENRPQPHDLLAHVSPWQQEAVHCQTTGCAERHLLHQLSVFWERTNKHVFFCFVLFFKIISPSQPSTCGCHILTLFLISVYDWVNRSATGQRRRADVCLWRLILRLRNSGWRTETVFNKRRDSTAPCHGEKSFRFCRLNSTQLPVGPCFSPCPAADLSRSFCPLSTYSVDFFDFHQFTFFLSLTVYVFFLFFPATAWIITCHRLTFEWTWHSYWNLK